MFKGRQFDQAVILLCVRWYLAYNLSLRDLEEMMAERRIAVDQMTICGLTVRTLLLEHFDRPKRSVTGKWQVDETYGCIFTAPSTVSATQSNSVQRAS